ncbi:MAG: TonB-dependent receptor plug domain-containing protein, partial [Chitinophagaceae bacterium]|nr:TonB-dependent receptor plug domain-containing protein [Chitinophagaceae bacterium]
MRLTVFLLTAAFVQVYATGRAQHITLTAKDMPLKQVFAEIKAQTGYLLFSNTEFLNKAKKVTVTARNMPLLAFLDIVFKDQPLEYSIQDNTISLSEKASPPKIDPPFERLIILPETFPLVIKVVDSLGKPLPGASISNKTDKVLGLTNAAGSFMHNVSEGDILLISFIGYETRIISVTPAIIKEGALIITLKAASNIMDEVAVVSTGYQNLPRERVTGSFSTIPKQYLDKPAINLASRLIGTMAGLSSTLDADGNPSFEVRGQTSLYANAQPLLVVDGFPVEGGFRNINPNDVESVTVLKDAAAASIWGARAANGVIVVTTKKASAGNSLKIELNSFVKLSPKTDLDYINPLASSAETIDYEKRAFNKWGSIQNNGNLQLDYAKAYSQGLTALNEQFLGHITAQERDNILSALSLNDNRDQIRNQILAAPITQQYNLTISSATARSNNFLSLLFTDNQSRFKETKDKNYMLNYRTSSKVFRFLDFRISGMAQYQEMNNSGLNIGDIKSLSPYDMLLDPNGNYTNVINSYYQPIIDKLVPVYKFPYADWSYNPIVEMNNRNITDKNLNLRLQAGLTAKLLKGLSYDAGFQFEYYNTDSRSHYREGSFYVRNLVNTTSTWN